MPYVGRIYRPPSEAYSFILQITVGCSHNSCSFCSMYKDKKYRVKDWAEIAADIQWAKAEYGLVRRVFLADGDALSADTALLVKVITALKAAFPRLERVAAYAGPWSLLEKTPEDLQLLREAGLNIVYLGLESGSPEILKKIIKKTAGPPEMIAAAQKARSAGILLSVTIILGIGGQSLSALHARETASVLNAMQPDYLGALTLMLEPGAPLLRKVEQGEFTLLTPVEILAELRSLIAGLELNNCVFRSNHASNYLDVRGTLPKDKERLLRGLDSVLADLDSAHNYLRPEDYRRL